MLKPENLLLSFSSVARSFLGFSQKKKKKLRLCHSHLMCHKPESHERRGKHDNEVIQLLRRRTYWMVQVFPLLFFAESDFSTMCIWTQEASMGTVNRAGKSTRTYKKLSRTVHLDKESGSGCVMYDWKARGNVGIILWMYYRKWSSQNV